MAKKYHINSVVVMAQNNADKIECKNVVNLRDLKSYIKDFNDGTKLTVEEMDEIYNTLLKAGADMSNHEYVRNIRETQRDLRHDICPRCGGTLVEKSGKYGKFKGCSNYPKCTFILKEK